MKEGMQEISRGIHDIETLDELRAVQDLVRERWHELQRAETIKFKKGDIVQWTKQRKTYSGEVLSTNVTSVMVKCFADGVKWKIGSTCLKIIEQAK